MTTQSAFDVVQFEVGPEQKPVFVWLCAERAAGVWRLNGGRVGDLLQEALTAVRVWHGVSAERPKVASFRDLHQAVLDELHPDCDFGQFHTFRVEGVALVADALEAVIGDLSEEKMAYLASQAALGEILMIKGAYYMSTGSYDGVYEHRAFLRQIQWQVDDLESLRSGSNNGAEQLLTRAVERGFLLAEEIRQDRLI